MGQCCSVEPPAMVHATHHRLPRGQGSSTRVWSGTAASTFPPLQPELDVVGVHHPSTNLHHGIVEPAQQPTALALADGPVVIPRVRVIDVAGDRGGQHFSLVSVQRPGMRAQPPSHNAGFAARNADSTSALLIGSTMHVVGNSAASMLTSLGVGSAVQGYGERSHTEVFGDDFGHARSFSAASPVRTPESAELRNPSSSPTTTAATSISTDALGTTLAPTGVPARTCGSSGYGSSGSSAADPTPLHLPPFLALVPQQPAQVVVLE